MPRIAYLGPEGTFTEAALLKISASGLVPGNASSDGITPIPTESTPAALAAVRSGDADYACVPIENSIEGSVLPTLDNLATGTPLQIFAELTLDVAFTIVVRRGHAGRRCRDGGRLPGGRRAGAALAGRTPARTRKWCRPTRTPRPRTMSHTGAPTPG